MNDHVSSPFRRPPAPRSTRFAGLTSFAILALSACEGGGADRTGAPLSLAPTAAIVAPRSDIVLAPRTLTTPLANLPEKLKAQDFRLNPPEMRQVAFTRGEKGSRLFVSLTPDRRVGDTFTLTLDGDKGEPITLKRVDQAPFQDKGDFFAADVAVPFDEVQAAQKQWIARWQKQQAFAELVFDGRQVVGKRRLDFEVRDDLVLVPLGGTASLVDAARSLMVTDPSVVEDPTRTGGPCLPGGNPSGAWTFKHLVEEMANQAVTGTNPADLAELWLNRWATNQVVNGFNAPARTAVSNILTSWPRVGGKLDLTQAPFKLVAIVNRIDLAGNPTYGRVGGAEGRFVFELLDRASCSPQQFLVIFEYGIPRDTCTGLRDWAQRWQDLGTLALGSAAYNGALEALTEEFVRRNADPSKPNGSALNQLRTNEILGFPWELREFKLLPLFPEVPLLRPDTVKQTPDISFNTDPALGAFINTLPDPYTTPAAMLGAAITSGPGPLPFWNPPGVTDFDRRERFSLNTCNGCHAGETGTAFKHIGTPPVGTGASLSGFLTGITVADPVNGVSRSFNDLAHRAARLDAFASASCSIFDFRERLRAGAFVRPLPPVDVRPLLSSH